MNLQLGQPSAQTHNHKQTQTQYEMLQINRREWTNKK